MTPDANWYLLRGLYLHQIDALANKFTLAHLKKYNTEWGIPVPPGLDLPLYECEGGYSTAFTSPCIQDSS